MMKKYKYNIVNLDCANCARGIEEELNKNPKLNNVIVNFSTSIISYESDDELDLATLNKLVQKIEPEASVVSLYDEHLTKEYHFSYLIMGILFGIFGIYLNLPWNLDVFFTIIGYVLLLYKPFISFIKSKSLNENALIVISCIGAYFVGEKLEGIMVVSLYLVGKILEEKAINNTRSSIKGLMNLKQDYANKKEKDDIVKVDVEDIKINDVLVIKNGEKIPVDGVVTKGKTELDCSALTGESEFSVVKKGDKVLSGTINMGDVIEIRAITLFEYSTVSRIINLISDATDKKAVTETLVAKISKIYTPIVMVLAVFIVIFLPIFFDISYVDSIYRGLTFLVISCPCAIAISVPLSYFTGIGVSSWNGILIKGSNYLDNLGNLKKIVFDKTGTITTGTFEVKNIEIFDDNYSKEDIIDILVKGESFSNHPIAKSIMKLTDKKVDNCEVKNYKEIAGKGICFTLNGDEVRIGTIKNCNCDKEANIHLNINNNHVASISIDDGIKKEARECISKLKALGITTYMFTGDSKEVALEIAERVGIDEVKAEMLPATKYLEYERLESNKEIIAFVGDGINDAPVLKRASIGISMGSIGQQVAIEASDIVIMTDDLSKIPLAIYISNYTNRIIKQNLLFAIGVKIVMLLLSVVGVSSMWFAVFADTGVTLITILNTLKILKKFK